jgi:predicted AlkP superfamily phosphohydrolase/phosphomutase
MRTLLLLGATLLASCSEHGHSTDPSPPADPMPRLLVFGIDGATWDVIVPLIEAGRMPNFTRLCAGGRYAGLGTTTPNLSPILWTTIATGEPADVHGIEGFTVEVEGSTEVTLPSSNLRRVPAFWNILSDAGQTVGLVNWWVSYPAEPIDGFVISDRANFVRKSTYKELFDLEDTDLQTTVREVHPPELYLEIARHVHPSTQIDRGLVDRIVELPDPVFDELQTQERFSRESKLSVLKFALLQDESVLAAGLQALAQYEPDVMVFYTSGLDAVEHHFWQYHEPEKYEAPPTTAEIALFGEAVRNYYVYVDGLLGRLLAAYGDEALNVLVVSDHGHVAYEDFGTEHATGYGKIASGWHGYAPPGVVLLAGPGIAPGNDLSATIFDIAPTILALRGVPVAEDVQGTVLTDAFTPEQLARQPVTLVPSYRAMQPETDAVPVRSAADEELLEKLRALGYIE